MPTGTCGQPVSSVGRPSSAALRGTGKLQVGAVTAWVCGRHLSLFSHENEWQCLLPVGTAAPRSSHLVTSSAGCHLGPQLLPARPWPSAHQLQSQQVGRAQAGARTLEPCVFLRTLGELKEGRSWSPQTGVPRDPSSGRWTLTAIPASPGPRLALRLTGSPSSSWARPQADRASLRAAPAIHFPSPEARGCPGRRPLPNTNTIRACLFKQRPVMDV